MKGVLAALVFAIPLLAVLPSDASAYYCRAIGLGRIGTGVSASIVRAKLLALRRCEARAGLHVCTIVYCR